MSAIRCLENIVPPPVFRIASPFALDALRPLSHIASRFAATMLRLHLEELPR